MGRFFISMNNLGHQNVAQCYTSLHMTGGKVLSEASTKCIAKNKQRMSMVSMITAIRNDQKAASTFRIRSSSPIAQNSAVKQSVLCPT